jgi:hypothetical protein
MTKNGRIVGVATGSYRTEPSADDAAFLNELLATDGLETRQKIFERTGQDLTFQEWLDSIYYGRSHVTRIDVPDVSGGEPWLKSFL